MSFDNFYPNRKDHRRPYRKSRRFDHSCRNHGSCSYCRGNRLFFDRKRRYFAELDLEDWLKGRT